jgi:hypothetical protein
MYEIGRRGKEHKKYKRLKIYVLPVFLDPT